MYLMLTYCTSTYRLLNVLPVPCMYNTRTILWVVKCVNKLLLIIQFCQYYFISYLKITHSCQ